MGHHHHHQHGHAHPHGATSAQGRRRLAITLAITGTYMVAELVGGVVSGSLALLADAGHMLSDVAALALGLFAMWIAQRPADDKRTYGYARTEILAAMLNGATLFAMAVLIVLEAFERFSAPPPVNAPLAAAIAGGGLLMNLVVLRILARDRHDSLNMRAAFLHVASDTLGSVGALLSAAAIWGYGWQWADPAASVLIALLVTRSAWHLLKETVVVLMEGAPKHVDVDALRRALADLGDVASVHDLHVWTITSKQVCMSAHVVAGNRAPKQQTLEAITHLLRERFGIHHVTIQVEDEGFAHEHCADCGSEPGDPRRFSTA
jgi:cobalt-zinc-cadmium efflux system protein